ncbi:hypothetical protein DOY81_010068 [Sarcophaga bullata]|nr:hypothetical protein DOY81_010068 [Sarcophaga bullata]
MQLEAYGSGRELVASLQTNESTELGICLSYSQDENKLREAIKILQKKNLL